MIYGENDKVVDFSTPVIHVYCKNSTVIPENASFANEIHGRPNVLLMGDSLGDVSMDVGAKEEQASLKIGFVNHDVRFKHQFIKVIKRLYAPLVSLHSSCYNYIFY